MKIMTQKQNSEREQQLEQLQKVFQVNGMNPTPEQLERIHEFSQVLEQIIRGTFVCSKCGENQHMYEIRSN